MLTAQAPIIASQTHFLSLGDFNARWKFETQVFFRLPKIPLDLDISSFRNISTPFCPNLSIEWINSWRLAYSKAWEPDQFPTCSRTDHRNKSGAKTLQRASGAQLPFITGCLATVILIFARRWLNALIASHFAWYIEVSRGFQQPSSTFQSWSLEWSIFWKCSFSIDSGIFQLHFKILVYFDPFGP